MITRITFVYTIILITRLNAQADCSSKVDSMFIKDSAVPVKGQSLQLNCMVQNFKDSSTISLTRSDLAANEQITQCIISFCTNVPYQWKQSYTVSSDNSGVYLQIKSLNRSEDENTWICKNPCAESKSLQLKVNTVPQLLQFENPPSQDVDLGQNTVTLKCSTGCAYPQPSITWFYNEIGDSRQEWSTYGSVSNKTEGCTDSERIYTSSLSLQRYTTLPDNADKTVKFSCGITSFPGLTQSLYTRSYVNVRFAVYATTPTITGHTTENRVVFENDTVTLECISSITRPVALVTWKKGSNNLTNIVNTVTNHDRGRASIKSTVTVTLNRNDNNKHITCETYIPGQENKASAQQGITVYWPPSTPSIPSTNFPFLEGQKDKSIYCQTNEYGNPTATALWSSKYGAPASSDSRQLNLPILSSKHDGISASCQLKNQFSETKTIVIQSPSIKIAVEYSPIVTILESNNEITTITKKEGQRIFILCNAIGNPDPTVSWYGQTPDDKYLRFDDLDRTDNGTYTCKASAISTSYPQHNFKTEKNFDVVVNYEASITSFYIDGHRGQTNVTVDENDGGIQFTCKVDSNPPSTVKIMFNGEVIKERSNTKQISMVLSSVACLDGGEYTCEGYNQYGQSSMIGIKLFVYCSPRPLHQMRQNITSFLHVPVTLSFTALAYPHPGTKGFAWFKEHYVDWYPVLSNADLHISSSASQSNLTILNVSNADYGRYRLTVTNEIGSFVQYLLLEEDVQENEGLSENRTKETENAALITGISLGVVVIVLAIYAASITILYKRKTESKDKQVDVKESTQKTYVNIAYKPNIQENENNDGTTEANGDETRQYTDLVGYPRDDRTTYEVLQDL